MAFFGKNEPSFCIFWSKKHPFLHFWVKRNVSLCFFFLAKGASLSPFLVKEASFLEFFGKKKHLFCIFWCIGLLPPLLKPKVWDAGWVFWENLFGFIIRASRSTFLSAAIFDFVKFHFWFVFFFVFRETLLTQSNKHIYSNKDNNKEMK